MAGSRNQLKALIANLRVLGASGALEQGQEKELIKASQDLWRAVSTGRRREIAKSIDKLSRSFIDTRRASLSKGTKRR
jgi:hypothetical protein